MSNAKITAPPDPATAAKARSEALKAKGNKRTPAEAAEYLDTLEARITALESAP